MESQNASVSVVVPCYKYGRFLEKCVNSILTQEHVDVRVLVIDDHSPDDSYAVACRLASLDSRVSVRRHEKNLGHIATYNEGLLEWAEGEFSVLISADDMLAPGALARAVAVMRANPAVGLVYGHAVNWRDDLPPPEARVTPTFVRVWSGHDWVRTVCRLGHNVVTSPEVVVRTKIQKEIGGYLPELPHSGDLEMWLRFAAHSDVAFIEGVDQAYYRIHANNMTVSRTPLVDLVQRVEAFDRFFAESGQKLPDASLQHDSARRQIAREALWRACRAYDRGKLQEVPIDDIKVFAKRVYPQAETLWGWRGLKWRAMVGPTIAFCVQGFVVPGIYRRIRSKLWWRRWRRKGY